MHVQEIWRYPVKSMAGEMLDSAHLSPAGIDGDREIQVRNSRGRVITSRTHPGLLGHKATLDPNGEPLVDGRRWNEAAVLADVRKIAGPTAVLVRSNGADRFDVLPLLVATDGAIAQFGKDRRRLRPNIVIAGVRGMQERTWEGSALRIGDVVIAVEDLRSRCIMTTLAHDPQVLRDIVERFGGKLALNCDVVQGGTIHVGQEVELLLH